jgi:hypothetical protein
MAASFKAKSGNYGTSKRASQLILTSIIVTLVVELVILVPLVKHAIHVEKISSGNGLQERASVLLESVAQVARAQLPSEDLLQLEFLPELTKAMHDAVYITITGYSDDNLHPDLVWASNDPNILGKIETSTFQPGVSQLKDSLTPKLPALIERINKQSASEAGDISKTLYSLSEETQKLAPKQDIASQNRLKEISALSRIDEKTISDKLLGIANANVGSVPPFDSAIAATRNSAYLFYKPILYRHGQDQLYYRGMVRLEVNTQGIVAEAQKDEADFVKKALIVAIIALCIGIAGAFLLATKVGCSPKSESS